MYILYIKFIKKCQIFKKFNVSWIESRFCYPKSSLNLFEVNFAKKTILIRMGDDNP